MKKLVGAAGLAFVLTTFTSAYTPVPALNRRALAGIWRLTNERSFLPSTENTDVTPRRPLKEFTTYPKKEKEPRSYNVKPESYVFIKLKEDGSFEVPDMSSTSPSEEYEDELEKENETQNEARKGNNMFNAAVSSTISAAKFLISEISKGSWDFRDGKLILATDRPANADSKHVHDTILVGKVMAEKEEGLTGNPVLEQRQNSENDNTTEEEKGTSSSDKDIEAPESDSSISQDKSSNYEIHLSVPKGKIKIGKYMYPKNHPSFFETPIFDPTMAGSFELRQVLGTLKTSTPHDEDEIVEKFKREQLSGKRFFVTSVPVEPKRKKKERWSRSLKRYVEVRDPDTKSENENIFGIRAMELELFANGTFATMAGLGETVLRGKWDIIGKEYDQLWMQISRFGFGRSVSGSVFSEGTSLTKEDEKMYWGKIKFLEEDTKNVPQSDNDSSKTASTGALLEIKGSVMFGSGLAPEPIGRFTMVERASVSEEEGEDKDEDEEEEEGDDESEGMIDATDIDFA